LKLLHRLLLYSLTVITVLVVAIVAIIDRRLHTRIVREITTELAREARLVGSQWTSSQNADALADMAGAALHHRVTLIDRNGVVVGDSEFSGNGLNALENHFRRPEVVSARVKGFGSSQRLSSSRGDEELYVAVAQPLGVTRVSVPTRAVDQIFDLARRDILSAGIAAMIVAILLSVVFARSISRPITELGDVARAMADRDFSRPAVKASGEVGDLAVSVHRLSTQIESLESMRRDFVANVSHELRTPLTIVGGFAETLVHDDPPRESRREFAGMILSNTRRMQRIVDDLLDLSRIESGGWVPKPSEVDLGTIAAEIVGATSESASAKGTRVMAAISVGASRAYADRTALRQILSNLVENAIRHTSGGEVRIFSERETGGVWIGVTDTGEGIAPDHLTRIFERFYRADPGRARDQGGTGLGLAIVKHLVEAHGGRVSATSEAGKGTRISALFPNRFSAGSR
jgi:two-component system, OmpR family, phosphate regulon sensor histidine kinase PhoR